MAIKDELDMVIGFYGTDHIGLAEELKKRIEQGDYYTRWDRHLANRLIRKSYIAHWKSQQNTPQGLAQRQTRAAERTALAAYIAICVSVLALGISVTAYIKPPESPESVKSTNTTPTPLTAGKASQKPASSIATK